MANIITTNHLFGGCPNCGGVDGMANAGRKHFFYCKKHKTMWSPGINIFSSAKQETEQYQRERWNKIGLETFNEVTPIVSQEFIHSQ